MQLSNFLGCSLVLALLPWSLPTQESGFRSRPLPRDTKERDAFLTERILGAWQLIGATTNGLPVRSGDVAGYLLVQDDFLAIEVHMYYRSMYTAGGKEDQPFFQSGTHRWRFAGPNRLQTSSVIGNTNMNSVERWAFEQPGTQRLFNMTLTETSLVLEKPGESQLTFRKLPRLPFPGTFEGFDRKPPGGEAEGEGGGRR